MWLNLLYLFAGLALIIKGGDLFVSSSVRIAEMLRMPRVVIGSTLVSLATTTPEMVVSILSGLKNESGLAVGNALGSCICNIGLILGIMAVGKNIDINFRTLRTPLTFMIGCGLLLFALSLDLKIDRAQGFLLLALGLGYFGFDFWRNLRQPSKSEIREATAIEQEKVSGHKWLRGKPGTAAVFLFGAMLVTLGSKLLVDGAIGVAEALKIPSLIIGLTVVAVGTSLPELVTAITSARQNVSDLAVGNVLGANIANLTLIVGSAAGLHDVTLTRANQSFNFPALLVFFGMLFWLMRSGKTITRREGAMLLVAYCIYLSALMLVALSVRL
jgi:cation:H+ antiporter